MLLSEIKKFGTLSLIWLGLLVAAAGISPLGHAAGPTEMIQIGSGVRAPLDLEGAMTGMTSARDVRLGLAARQGRSFCAGSAELNEKQNF